MTVGLRPALLLDVALFDAAQLALLVECVRRAVGGDGGGVFGTLVEARALLVHVARLRAWPLPCGVGARADTPCAVDSVGGAPLTPRAASRTAEALERVRCDLLAGASAGHVVALDCASTSARYGVHAAALVGWLLGYSVLLVPRVGDAGDDGAGGSGGVGGGSLALFHCSVLVVLLRGHAEPAAAELAESHVLLQFSGPAALASSSQAGALPALHDAARQCGVRLHVQCRELGLRAVRC